MHVRLPLCAGVIAFCMTACSAAIPSLPSQSAPPAPTEVLPLLNPARPPTSPTPAATPTRTAAAPQGMALIPAGEFQMGDHHGFVDPQHPSDEVPIHTVRLNSFYIAINDVTNQQYFQFLNSALSQSSIKVDKGFIYGASTNVLYADTNRSSQFSQIGWDGQVFTVLNQRGNHPVTGVRWAGAAAYTNWLSVHDGYAGCYDLVNEKCDSSKKGYRLPTEAEWEYAARGGRYAPYYIFPCGDTLENAKANFPASGDPYESGPYPWTTPVGFYNGDLRRKADFGWPGPQDTYQTANGADGYGLYDMAGNVWQWVNDWYSRDYYRLSPAANPPGPDKGDPMPDGKAYHVLRGGNWYNGEDGHARVANRDSGYYRGPEDPNHPYYHVGFRVVLDATLR